MAPTTGPRNTNKTGCLALTIASMLGVFAVLISLVSGGCLAVCSAASAKPIKRTTTASTKGALPPLVMRAQTKPAIAAVTNTTANCITVQRVDARNDPGLNDQSAPITV